MKQVDQFKEDSEAVAQILTRASLPHAPLPMPKQVIETKFNPLFSIYSRLVRRQ